MALVELGDALRRGFEENGIGLQALGRRIDPVGEQCEMKIALGACEMMDF